MTEPIDDLLSAVLDGDATAAERDRVAADPALVARLEGLAAARGAVATDAPRPDPAARARAIAVALTAAEAVAGADDRGAADSGAPTPPPPTVLRPRPARRRWLAAGAAAAVLLAGVAVASVVSSRNNGDTVDSADIGREALDATTAGGGTSAVTRAAGEDDTGAGAAATPPQPASAQRGDLPDLGAVDATSLREALASLEAESATQPAADTVLAAPACPAPVTGAAVAATATWGGAAAIVFTVAEAPARALVVLADGCSQVAEVPLA